MCVLLLLFILGARIFRQNLTLNLNEIKGVKKIPVFGFNTAGRGLNLNLGGVSGVDVIDISLPLDRQGYVFLFYYYYYYYNCYYYFAT